MLHCKFLDWLGSIGPQDPQGPGQHHGGVAHAVQLLQAVHPHHGGQVLSACPSHIDRDTHGVRDPTIPSTTSAKLSTSPKLRLTPCPASG